MKATKLDIPVDEYSTPSPYTVAVGTPLEEVFGMMNEKGVRHVPVVEAGVLKGIISHRDASVAVCAMRSAGETDLTVEEVMAIEPYTCKAEDPLDKVAFHMSDRKIGSAVVVDEANQPVSIFTATDALNALIEVIRGEV